MKGRFAEDDLPVVKKVLNALVAAPTDAFSLSSMMDVKVTRSAPGGRKQFDRIRIAMETLERYGVVSAATVSEGGLNGGRRIRLFTVEDAKRAKALIEDPVELASVLYGDGVTESMPEDEDVPEVQPEPDAERAESAPAAAQPTQQYDMVELSFRATMGLVERVESTLAAVESMKGKQDAGNALLLEMGKSISGVQDAIILLTTQIQKLADEVRNTNAVAGCAFKRATETTAAHVNRPSGRFDSNGKKTP